MKSVLLAGVALWALPTMAWAQTQMSSGAPGAHDAAMATVAAAASPPEAVGMQDIVVTAQRRSEPLQRAAVAVDVVSSDAVLAGGVTKATDLTALVPALQGAGAGSSTSFYLRGVGAFTANAYTDPAVAFNYDGVYIARPAATTGMFYDIDRVEVLKGPQGTLYGRNATGGAINVLPTKPVLNSTSGYIDGSYGNYDAFAVQGAINLPLGTTAALRVSGNVVRRNGYMDDGTDDDKGEGLRAQVRWVPMPDLDVRLAADYFHAGGKGPGANYRASSSFSPVTGTYTITPSGLPDTVDVYDPHSAPFRATSFSGISGRTLLPLVSSPAQDNTIWGINADINYTTPIGTLSVTPAYREFHQKTTEGSGGFTVDQDQTFKQTSLEARLASDPHDRLSWLLGGYYYHEDATAPHFTVLMQVLDSFQTFEQKTDSAAGFGRLTFRATDTLRLVAGARYTHDQRSFDGTADVFVDVCTAPTHACPTAPLLPFATSVADTVAKLGLISVTPNNSVYIQPSPAAANTIFARGITTLDLSRTDSKVTYHAGVEYDAGPASLLYASFDTGFRSGGFAFSTFKPTFDPESIDAYTLGAKNRFFDNTLQLNLELFLWKYKNQQVSHLGPDPALGSTFYTENIGRSTNKGFEVELKYQPVHSLTFTGDFQYLSAKFDSFAYKIPALSNGNPVPPPLTGCAVTPPGAFVAGSSYTIDCSGQTAFRAPRWTVNMGVEKSFEVNDLLLTLDANTRYQTANLTGFEFVAEQVQAAYWTTNLSATIGSVAGGWSLTGFVNNIENRRRLSLTYYDDPISSFTGVLTAPRTYGLRANYRF